MRHRSNYDWMLFLTSPMAFVKVQTHDFVLTRQPPLTPRPQLLSLKDLQTKVEFKHQNVHLRKEFCHNSNITYQHDIQYIILCFYCITKNILVILTLLYLKFTTILVYILLL